MDEDFSVDTHRATKCPQNENLYTIDPPLFNGKSKNKNESLFAMDIEEEKIQNRSSKVDKALPAYFQIMNPLTSMDNMP